MAKKGDRTRRALLEGAMVSIARLGIEHTSHARIAELTGVSRSLVAHYFPDKKALFPAVIDHVVAEVYEYFDANRKNLPAGTNLALAQLRWNLEFFCSHPDHYRCIVLLYYTSTYNAKLRSLNTRLVAAAVGSLRAGIADQGRFRDAGEVAEILHNQLIATIQKYFMTKRSRNRRVFVEEEVARFGMLLDRLSEEVGPSSRKLSRLESKR